MNLCRRKVRYCSLSLCYLPTSINYLHHYARCFEVVQPTLPQQHPASSLQPYSPPITVTPHSTDCRCPRVVSLILQDTSVLGPSSQHMIGVRTYPTCLFTVALTLRAAARRTAGACTTWICSNLVSLCS